MRPPAVQTEPRSRVTARDPAPFCPGFRCAGVWVGAPPPYVIARSRIGVDSECARALGDRVTNAQRPDHPWLCGAQRACRHERWLGVCSERAASAQWVRREASVQQRCSKRVSKCSKLAASRWRVCKQASGVEVCGRWSAGPASVPATSSPDRASGLTANAPGAGRVIR